MINSVRNIISMVLAIVMMATMLVSCFEEDETSSNNKTSSANSSVEETTSGVSIESDAENSDEQGSEENVSSEEASDIISDETTDEFVGVERIEFTQDTYYVKRNLMQPIGVNVYPENATNKNYTLSSSDTDIVSITLVNVMPKKYGQVTISVTSQYDPEIYDTCTVIVTDTGLPETTSSEDITDESSDEPSEETSEETSEESSVEVHSHVYDTFVGTVNPTCTAEGYTIYKCTCGKREQRDYTEAKGHTEGDWKVVKEATTTSTGLKQKACTVCGTVLKEATIDKITSAHTCSYTKSSTVAATCTAQGYTIYKCSCGNTKKQDYTSALGHNAGNWVVITEATTTSTGLQRKSCTRCGITMEEQIIDKTVEDPDAKYYVTPSTEYIELLEERILYYLNYFRKLDGASEVTALLNGKTFLYARGRAEQISVNFGHITEDERKLATELEFGYYHESYPESYYDLETDKVIYTGNMIPAYYTAACSEALTGGYFGPNYFSIDDFAYDVAEGCYDSKSHWNYVGAETTKYITVGAYSNLDGELGTWYFCIATSSETAAQYD